MELIKPSGSFDSSESDEASLEEFELQEARFAQLYDGECNEADAADEMPPKGCDDPTALISAITERLQQIAVQCKQLAPHKQTAGSPPAERKDTEGNGPAVTGFHKTSSEISSHPDDSQPILTGGTEAPLLGSAQCDASDFAQDKQSDLLSLLEKKEKENAALRVLLAERTAQLNTLSTKLQLALNERDDLAHRLDKIMSGSLVPDDEDSDDDDDDDNDNDNRIETKSDLENKDKND